MLRLRSAAFAAIGLSLFVAPATHAGLISTVEGPGVQTSSALNTTVIDFDSVTPTGYHDPEVFSLPGSLTATYTGTQFVDPANQYGGAGGIGNYFSVQAGQTSQSVTLTLSASQAYFGLWISAADSANQLEFFNGNQSVGSFSAASSEITLLPSSYLGNPNAPFLNDNNTEQYVFVNFYAQTANDMFDKIVFTNLAGATEFESDNHTFSTTLQAPSSVPEPTSLALGLVGTVGFLGYAANRRMGSRTKRAATSPSNA